jgi:Domain of unknown function (DUF4399)
MKRVVFASLVAMLVGCFSPLNAKADDFWPKDAKVYFIEPADGATITGKVTVKFGLAGLGVAPAGVDKPKTGHHHILVDADLPQGAELQDPIMMDEHHRHFGGGQTETVLELSPGQHTLQLLMGDTNHVPHDPPLASEKITITVQ